MIGSLDTKKTISAIITPIGVGGVSIVRLSGDNAVKIADKFFCAANNLKPSSFDARKLMYGTFNGKTVKDKCLCVVFKKPNSYTGEDVVEFQCHGGIKLASNILEEVNESGATLAECGEFSLRAFLNGKMNLSEAEGMIDLINAESDSELKAGYSLLNGTLSQKVNAFQESIVDLISDIEVSFDYPEEDIEYTESKKAKEKIEKLIEELDVLIASSKTGSIIKNGINCVIVGKPNVGKSSLLNALINKNKAIVTDIAGTTRDVIEDAFEVNGVKVNVLDTAGIRETKDIVERFGVEKSKELIGVADIILFVVDSSCPLDEKDAQILSLLSGKKYLTIYNKADRLKKPKIANAIYTVAKTGEGITELKQKIYDLLINKSVISGGLIITNARHTNALKKAKDALQSALAGIENFTLDLIAIDLKESYEALGEITGTTSNEEILDSIFSKFCLGK